jgi:flagellar protein FliS
VIDPEALVNPYNAYAQANIMIDEQDKGKVLLKVFEALPGRIELVKTLIVEKKFERKFQELSRIVNILEVLDASLDMSFGEIAANLSALYTYLMKRLREVHSSLDLQTLDECKKIIATLAEAFGKAYELDRRAKTTGQPLESPARVSLDSRI